MPTPKSQTQRTEIESQIKSDFSEIQKKLENLKNEIEAETDATEKQKKNEEIKKTEKEASELKALIDTLSSLQEQDLQSLKTKLESLKVTIQEFSWKFDNLAKEIKKNSEKEETPKTYELLEWSETYTRLLNIISSNQDKFAKVKWNSPKEKLDNIFKGIHDSVVQFLKNKLWNSEKYDKIIDNTMAPAFEWSMMEMLKNQWNEKNVSMLEKLNNISLGSFEEISKWIKRFAKNTKWSFSKFSQWVNALDYLSVHNQVLDEPEKSAVMTNPIEFKNYLNNPIFDPKDQNGNSVSFSPYNLISENVFKIDENQKFEFWITAQEKQSILEGIWNIQVANNPKTTELITKMIGKSGTFFETSKWFQKVVNGILDWANALNSVTKLVGIDLLWVISQPPEKRWVVYRIIDFVCKLLWISWWLEWIVKKWRLNRLNLTDEKNKNISLIFIEYQKLTGKWNDITINDANSCSSALADFELTDIENQSTTKWDHLRDVMADNMDINLVPVSVVQQTLWNDYLKKEMVTVNWKQQEKLVVDIPKITEEKKKELAHIHITKMKTHLEENYNDLSDFYTNIHNTDDLIICMIASLYADKEDVIEWIKAKVFLPENYGVTYEWNEKVDNNWQDNWWDKVEWNNEWNSEWNNEWNSEWNGKWRNNLDSTESSDKQIVSEQWMYDKIVEYWITNESQIAYILATAKLETNRSNQPWFKNIEEQWKGKREQYWKTDSETWKAYYGRWFVQLTTKENYKKYTEILRNSGKDFKDNDGNILKGSDIDLVNDPDTILRSNDLAAFILVHWMKNWTFTWKKLDDFINDTKTDFVGARQIVNWNDLARQWADYAQSYLNTLTA